MHIHSALSPCGDADMTPNNIVNMSIIKGLDVISVTDHNTAGNAEAVAKAADGRIIVVPGMEIESSEEVHIAVYFPDLESLFEMEKIVSKNMAHIKNKPEIYGEQLYMDSLDNITGTEENLLITATKLSVYDIFKAVRALGGVSVPAHIDKSSYSILSNLGALPADLGITAVEITPRNRPRLESEYKNFNILSNSDAHYLENISERDFYIDVFDKSVHDIINYLCKMR